MHMRRIVSAIALAGALVLAPTAAMADGYPAPETPDVTTSLPGTVGVAGESFTVTILAEDGDEATLTITNPDVPSSAIQIAGKATLDKPLINGAATFTVTLTQPGNYTLTAAVDGTVIWTKQLTVQAAAAGTGAGQGTGGAAGLPVTGTEALLYGVGTVLLIGAGAAVIVGARRRRSATS